MGLLLFSSVMTVSLNSCAPYLAVRRVTFMRTVQKVIKLVQNLSESFVDDMIVHSHSKMATTYFQRI